MSFLDRFLHQFPALNFIYTGGEEPNSSILKPIVKHGTYHVAADQGFHICQQLNLSPDILIGDFDSVRSNNTPMKNFVNSKTHLLEFQKDKDFTDTELAIRQVVSTNQNPIILIGGGGLQADHFMSNLITVFQTPEVRLWITAREFIVSLDSTLHIKHANNLRLSMFSFIDTRVSSKGLKWELENYAISNTQMTISNMCIDDHIEIKVLQGKAIVLLYPDYNNLNQLDFYYV